MAQETKKLADLMVTVGTYKDASGTLKGRSLNIGSVFVTGGRLWATIQGHLLPFDMANNNKRAMEGLGLKKDKTVNHEIQLSLLAEKGKPLQLADLAGQSATKADGGTEDDVDFGTEGGRDDGPF